MTLRPYVTFEDARHPADPGGVPEDPASPPPGRALADDLARRLEEGGLEPRYPVSPWESYGWEFTLGADGRDVWFLLQSTAWPPPEADSASEPGGEWLLLSETRRGFLERLRGQRFDAPHARALRLLAAFLVPPRFTGARWFTREEFEGRGPGADAPDA